VAFAPFVALCCLGLSVVAARQLTLRIDRSRSTAAWAEIQRVTDQIKALDAGVDRLSTAIGRLRGQQQDLTYQKQVALAELRQGLFCSQCMHSKSEIERSGESFEEHLRRVHGKPVPATQEQLRKKEQEFDQRIAALDEQIRGQETDRSAMLVERQGMASNRIARAIDAWRMALIAEDKDASTELRRRQTALAEQYAALLRSKAIADGERLGALEKQFADLLAFTRANDKYLEESRLSALTKLRDTVGQELAAKILPPNYSTPDLSWKFSTVKVGAKLEADRLAIFATLPISGYGHKVLDFQGGLKAGTDWFEQTMRVRAGFEAWGFGVGMERATEFKANRAFISDKPYVAMPAWASDAVSKFLMQHPSYDRYLAPTASQPTNLQVRP